MATDLRFLSTVIHGQSPPAFALTDCRGPRCVSEGRACASGSARRVGPSAPGQTCRWECQRRCMRCGNPVGRGTPALTTRLGQVGVLRITRCPRTALLLVLPGLVPPTTDRSTRRVSAWPRPGPSLSVTNAGPSGTPLPSGQVARTHHHQPSRLRIAPSPQSCRAARWNGTNGSVLRRRRSLCPRCVSKFWAVSRREVAAAVAPRIPGLARLQCPGRSSSGCRCASVTAPPGTSWSTRRDRLLWRPRSHRYRACRSRHPLRPSTTKPSAGSEPHTANVQSRPTSKNSSPATSSADSCPRL